MLKPHARGTVIYFHGFCSSSLEAGLLHADALHHGLSVIAVDRPGAGHSTLNDKQASALHALPTFALPLLAGNSMVTCHPASCYCSSAIRRPWRAWLRTHDSCWTTWAWSGWRSWVHQVSWAGRGRFSSFLLMLCSCWPACGCAVVAGNCKDHLCPALGPSHAPLMPGAALLALPQLPRSLTCARRRLAVCLRLRRAAARPSAGAGACLPAHAHGWAGGAAAARWGGHALWTVHRCWSLLVNPCADTVRRGSWSAWKLEQRYCTLLGLPPTQLPPCPLCRAQPDHAPPVPCCAGAAVAPVGHPACAASHPGLLGLISEQIIGALPAPASPLQGHTQIYWVHCHAKSCNQGSSVATSCVRAGQKG